MSHDPLHLLTGMLRDTREREVDCDTFVDRVSELIEGSLPDEQRALLEHHAALCPECAAHLQHLRRALE